MRNYFIEKNQLTEEISKIKEKMSRISDIITDNSNIEQDNVDVAMSNELQGSTSIDRGNFSGFSDSYFYRNVGSIEDNQ